MFGWMASLDLRSWAVSGMIETKRSVHLFLKPPGGMICLCRQCPGQEKKSPALGGADAKQADSRSSYLIAILRGCACSLLGTDTVSSPLSNAASTLLLSTCDGRLKERENFP